MPKIYDCLRCTLPYFGQSRRKYMIVDDGTELIKHMRIDHLKGLPLTIFPEQSKFEGKVWIGFVEHQESLVTFASFEDLVFSYGVLHQKKSREKCIHKKGLGLLAS